MIGPLGTRERLSYNKARWITTHYFLFLTAQVDGMPTDTKHHYGLVWYPIDALPPLFWPEQQALIATNRDTIIARLEP